MPEADILPLEPVFLVILDEVLVARDIELIICDLKTGAQVIVARTLADAIGRSVRGRIEAAFVQHDAAEFLASSIGRKVVEDGGRVVIAGREMSGLPGVATLPFPFTREHVAALLQGVLQD